MNNEIIVCEAEPFCYGPAATLASLIPWLQELGRVSVLASGTSLELLRRVPDIRVIALDENPNVRSMQYLESLRRATLAVGVLGNGLLPQASRMGVLTAFIDVLFWLWPEAATAASRSADLYFIEDHFDAAHQLDKRGETIQNPILVPPIIDRSLLHHADSVPENMAGKDQLLVTFGGVDSKLTSTHDIDHYLQLLTRSILSVVESESGFKTILFTGGGRVMDMIRSMLSSTTFPARALSLGHNEYLAELRRSKLLLSHPGLLTPLEAFSCGVPVAFLPPMNYTQLIQLRRFKALGIAPYALDWESLTSTCCIPEDLPEELGIRMVQQMVREFSRTSAAQTKLLMFLSTSLTMARTQLHIVAMQQRQRVQTHTSGGEAIVGILQRRLNHKTKLDLAQTSGDVQPF